MPKHHLSIDEETMSVLRSSAVTSSSVKLPAGQLARPLYMKVNKVLELAGGKWSRKEQAHTFSDDPREALGLAVRNGSLLDKKKATQAFYTPRGVASTVMSLASVQGKRVLEPSAGEGALAIACQDCGASEVFCIESDPKSAEILRGLDFGVTEADFLTQQPAQSFDRVVMNPPFTAGQDIAHVMHAFGFLKPGGSLVAIMSPSWESAQNRKAVAFRDLVQEHGRIAERLEAGAFKESGTDVATVIVVLDRL